MSESLTNSNVVTIYKKSTRAIQWLPVIPITLNDQAPCNGFIVVKHSDLHDPCVHRIMEIGNEDWVDEVIPQDCWRYELLFMSIIIDPSDFPYVDDE